MDESSDCSKTSRSRDTSSLQKKIFTTRWNKRPDGQPTSGLLQSTVELGYLDSARVYVDRRHSEVGSELICSICHNVLWKPVACTRCENAFCGSCIRTWTNTQHQFGPKTCPFNCKFREKRAPPILNSFLSKLQIYCAYASNGCEEILPYDGLERHEQTCTFEQTPCSVCQTPVSRRANNKHELRECFKQMYDQDPNSVQAQFIKLLDVVEDNKRRIAEQDQRIRVLETALGILH